MFQEGEFSANLNALLSRLTGEIIALGIAPNIAEQASNRLRVITTSAYDLWAEGFFDNRVTSQDIKHFQEISKYASGLKCAYGKLSPNAKRHLSYYSPTRRTHGIAANSETLEDLVNQVGRLMHAFGPGDGPDYPPKTSRGRPREPHVRHLAIEASRHWRKATGSWPQSTMRDGKIEHELFIVLPLLCEYLFPGETGFYEPITERSLRDALREYRLEQHTD